MGGPTFSITHCDDDRSTSRACGRAPLTITCIPLTGPAPQLQLLPTFNRYFAVCMRTCCRPYPKPRIDCKRPSPAGHRPRHDRQHDSPRSNPSKHRSCSPSHWDDAGSSTPRSHDNIDSNRQRHAPSFETEPGRVPGHHSPVLRHTTEVATEAETHQTDLSHPRLRERCTRQRNTFLTSDP